MRIGKVGGVGPWTTATASTTSAFQPAHTQQAKTAAAGQGQASRAREKVAWTLDGDWGVQGRPETNDGASGGGEGKFKSPKWGITPMNGPNPFPWGRLHVAQTHDLRQHACSPVAASKSPAQASS